MSEAPFVVEDVEATLVRWHTPGSPLYVKVVTLSRCALSTSLEFLTPMIMQVKIVGPSMDQFKKGQIVTLSIEGDKIAVLI